MSLSEQFGSALADRYTIERELAVAAWPRSISPATSGTTAPSRRVVRHRDGVLGM